MATRNIEHPRVREDPGSFIDPEILLARNLACFGPASAQAATRIREAPVTEIEFGTAGDGALTGTSPNGLRLASRHQPKEEARRLCETIDPAEVACILVLGFGVGHHVKELVDRFRKTGVVVVFEPDAGLLRAVFSRIDCTDWLDARRVRWIVGDVDHGAVMRCFSELETHLVAGTRILEHPPSASRVGEAATVLGGQLTEIVANARMSMTTLLMRSAGTVRNELANIDHYALGAGIDELSGAAAGSLGIVVSAGPSLQRNIRELAREGVRDRCIIIAAQTTLRPLLDAGIKPHFVCALDYHQISSRFYEGLTEEDVSGVTLVALPQAHPVIADSWPGAIRWCRGIVLEEVLGGVAGGFDGVDPAGTVAHLAYHLARYMGCDPVALIGQDLGFTDGVYYSRGTAIDSVWTPELNPFNTIAMMEWQRIVRHKGMLHRLEDINGRSILTDDQMLSYLRRFEELFARDEGLGLSTIDASEAGVRKSNTVVKPLSAVLAEHAVDGPIRLPAPPPNGFDGEGAGRSQVLDRIVAFKGEVMRLKELSRSTEKDLRELETVLQQGRPSDAVFERIDSRREEVRALSGAFKLVDRVNQLGAFKRFLSDRKIDLQEGSDPVSIQLQQIKRDTVNVRMLQEAADEAASILDDCIGLMRSEATRTGESDQELDAASGSALDAMGSTACCTDSVVALVPVDPNRGGAGSLRSLGETISGKNVLQHTLERLGSSRRLERIYLLVPDGLDVGELINASRIGLPVEQVSCGDSPFGPEHEAIIAARMFADRSWRGGIHGMTVFDEVLAAESMSRILEEHGHDAGVLCGPDWPCIEVLGSGGIDAMIDHWRAIEGRQACVFTQAPPGLGGFLVSRGQLAGLAPENRLATIGAMLGYRPERPEHDPVAREGNLAIDARVRGSLIRAVFDSPRCCTRMQRAVEPFISETMNATFDRHLENRDIVDQFEYVRRGGLPYTTPRHVIVELCTGRLGSGACSPHRNGSIQREPMTLRRFARIVAELGDSRDALLTLAGVGDPLQHPDCMEFIRMAFDAGVVGVHVRTELQCSPEVVRALAGSGAQVVSVELNADTPEIYRKAMGHDGLETALKNMELLIQSRRVLQGNGTGAFALPWVVPRFQRRIETINDLEGFHERWQRILGTPVIEPEPEMGRHQAVTGPRLADVGTPAAAMLGQVFRRMTILSDGRVPVAELDLDGRHHVGFVDEEPILELWRRVIGIRRKIHRDSGAEAFELRTYQP